jgi:hypothetical protein
MVGRVSDVVLPVGDLLIVILPENRRNTLHVEPEDVNIMSIFDQCDVGKVFFTLTQKQ